MIKKAALLALVFALTSVAALAADFNGKWHAKFSTPMGDMEANYIFHVNGNTLTGEVESDGQGPQSKLTDGKIDGDAISFTELIDMNGETLRINYKGKMTGDAIMFSKQIGDFGNDELTMTRVK